MSADDTHTRTGILFEVADELDAQNEKWGEQNHPNGTAAANAVLADEARMACQLAAAGGFVTFRHILEEEVFEAFAEEDPARLRAELVQVAAVAVQWIAAIDRAAADSDPQCDVCGRDNRNGTHSALEASGHLNHEFRS